MPFFKWVLFNGVFIHESFVKRLLFFFVSRLACSQREMQRSKFYSDKTFVKLLVGMMKIACMPTCTHSQKEGN